MEHSWLGLLCMWRVIRVRWRDVQGLGSLEWLLEWPVHFTAFEVDCQTLGQEAPVAVGTLLELGAVQILVCFGRVELQQDLPRVPLGVYL